HSSSASVRLAVPAPAGVELFDAPIGEMGLPLWNAEWLSPCAPWFGGARRTPGLVSGDGTHPEMETILHNEHCHVPNVVQDALLVKNSFSPSSRMNDSTAGKFTMASHEQEVA